MYVLPECIGIFGVIFLTLGITLYIMSDKIQDSVVKYDEECGSPKKFVWDVYPSEEA